MKITFLSPQPNLSGGIRVVAIHAAKLAARGHDVTITAVSPAGPTFKDQLRSLVKRGKLAAAPRVRTSHYDDLTLPVSVLNHSGPIRSADVPDADVCIATWWETAEWLAALPASKGNKVHFMQDYEIWGGDLARIDAAVALPIPKIVIARWVTQLLRERFGQTPLEYVPDSVDTGMFFAPPRDKQPVLTVGATYATMAAKGVDLAFAAVAQARRRFPALRLLVFGSCPPSATLPIPADASYFQALPNDRLRDVYGACDAWLFGTRKEGFGLPILEAMACRTPVIGAAAGAAPELLVQGGGILCPVEDAAALAAGIETIAAMSRERWHAMSDAAYATATKYTWDDAADLFERALLRAAAGGGIPC